MRKNERPAGPGQRQAKVEREKNSRNHALTLIEFFVLRDPRPPVSAQKGKAGYGSAKRKGGKEERVVLCCAWGALPGFSDRRRSKADRGEKSALRDGDWVGGRTDEVYTKVAGEGRRQEKETQPQK